MISEKKIHYCECRLVSYHWSVPAFMYFSCARWGFNNAADLCWSPGPDVSEPIISCLLSFKRSPDVRQQAKQVAAELARFQAAVRRRAWAKQPLQKPNHMMLYLAFKHTFGFVWEIENVCPIISEADHEYCVIKAILLCRFCTYPLFARTSFDSLFSSVNSDTSVSFFFMCNGPSSSDKDSYFVQSHTYYTLRVRQMCISHRWTAQDNDNQFRHDTHAFLCSCVDSLNITLYWKHVDTVCVVTFITWKLIFIVVVLIITIIYWHYSWVIIAELIPWDVLVFLFFFVTDNKPPPL